MKKLLRIGLGLLLAIAGISLANAWTVPDSITSDPYDDSHPAGTWGWIAWERSIFYDITAIFVKKMDESGHGWLPEENISRDVTKGGYPSIARWIGNGLLAKEKVMLVWQAQDYHQGKGWDFDIFYSFYKDNVWSFPEAVESVDGDDLHPSVVAAREDTPRFYLVWERGGSIWASDFYEAGGWSEPKLLVPADSTTYNSNPDAVVHAPQNLCAIWECRIDSTTEIRSLVTESGDTTWLTLSATDCHNLNPSFSQGDGIIALWESDEDGNWEIYSCDYYSPHPERERITDNPAFDLNSVGFNYYLPIERRRNWFFSSKEPVITTWQSDRDGNYNIFVYDFFNEPTRICDNDSSDQNPTMSISWATKWDSLYVWVIWETNRNGNWDLYGSRKAIDLGAVKGDPKTSLPIHLMLSQNYPNPFNPATVIRYSLLVDRSAISYQRSAVSLKIYNILGQEVRTLVSQEQRAGSYTVVWDGKDTRGKEVSSGVYFCRLEVEGLKAEMVRKMVLMK